MKFMHSLSFSMFCAAACGSSLAACGGSAVQADSETAATGEGDDREDIGDRSGPRRSRVPGMGDEDEEDGDVSVEGLRGYIDPYDINRAVQKNQRKISTCVGEGQADNAYLAGKLELSFVVGKSGSVKSVSLAQNNIGSWKVEKCLLAAAGEIQFARPRGGDAFFTVPLEFEPMKKPMWWGEDRTQTSISEEQMATVSACADKAPQLDSVWVTMYVGTDLAVQSTGFAWVKNPVATGWAECVIEATAQWTLTGPAIRRVGKLSFRYDKDS